jgi:hypothetical protein
MSSLEKKVRAILSGRYAYAGMPQPCLSLGDYVQIANSVRDRAGRPDEWCDPRGFAMALGHRLRPAPLSNCGGEVTDGRTLLYRPSPSRRRQGQRVWHGVAHIELVRFGEEHNESDAWLLTAELVIPARLAAVWSAEALIAVQPYAEEWLIEAQTTAASLALYVA